MEQQTLDAPRFQACVASCPGTVNGYECADRLHRFYGGMSPVDLEVQVLASYPAGSTERETYLSAIRDLNRYAVQCMLSPAVASCLRRCDSSLVSDQDLNLEGWHTCIAACPSAPAVRYLTPMVGLMSMNRSGNVPSIHEPSTDGTILSEDQRTKNTDLSKTLTPESMKAPETKTLLSNDTKTFLTDNTPPPATSACANNCARNSITCIKFAASGEQLQTCQKQTDQCNDACALMK